MVLFSKPSRKQCWYISIFTAVLIVIIISVAVPCGVILPGGGNHGQISTVLLPLYIYPEVNTTWSPLYDAVSTHPDLNFTVIINPKSGPGSSQYPDDRYITSVEKLNSYPNVQTVGYVRTGYASRNISTVLDEIATYSGWASNSSALAMDGIFFDEAPHQYSDAAVEYMRNINEAAKSATGLQRHKTVIHNPGTIPDARFKDINTDITVVFEDAYTAYSTARTDIVDLPKNRSEYSLMVHSVPTMSSTDLRTYVKGLSQRAEFLFITNNNQDFYESFGSQWDAFINAMPGLSV